MRRVMILGQPGSGKSTLARRIGERTGLPVVHIDHIHWQAGWIERPVEEKTRLCLAIEAQDAWIFEGGDSRTWANRAERADLVVWLDVPLGIRLWRVTLRTLRWYGQSRPDLPPGCVERIGAGTWAFYRYIWRTRRSARLRIARLVEAAPSGRQVVVLRRRAEVRAFLDRLGPAHAKGPVFRPAP
jgi:adenylate kinase family enzyme